MGVSKFNRNIEHGSWESICNHESVGGLRICRLSSINKGLLFKWAQNLIFHGSELWKNVVQSKYHLGSSLIPFIWWDSKLLSSWKELGKITSHNFSEIWRIKIGNGMSCLFYEDIWAYSKPLKFIFPCLFLVSLNP